MIFINTFLHTEKLHTLPEWMMHYALHEGKKEMSGMNLTCNTIWTIPEGEVTNRKKKKSAGTRITLAKPLWISQKMRITLLAEPCIQKLYTMPSYKEYAWKQPAGLRHTDHSLSVGNQVGILSILAWNASFQVQASQRGISQGWIQKSVFSSGYKVFAYPTLI